MTGDLCSGDGNGSSVPTVEELLSQGPPSSEAPNGVSQDYYDTLNRAEKAVCLYSPIGCAASALSAGIATNFAANEYPGMTTVNSPRDAFRHTRWQAELTQREGRGLAELWGAAHEYESTDLLETRMDQHNNAVGRDIGASYNGGVADAIRRARDRGELQMWVCPDIESTNSDFCS